MTLTNSLAVKQEELQVVQSKLNHLKKEEVTLQERGLMLLGAIEALQEQISIEEINNSSTEEADDD